MTESNCAALLVSELKALATEGVIETRCATIMPDHVHVLLRLGSVLGLSRVVARWKAKCRPALELAGLSWQKGFHEHRLRDEESRLAFFIYVFLNPYRAGLIPADAQWPWFVCSDEDLNWFSAYLGDGIPQPEWLDRLP